MPLVVSEPEDDAVEPNVEDDEPVSDDVLASLLVLVPVLVELPELEFSTVSPELDEQYVIPRSARMESISSTTQAGRGAPAARMKTAARIAEGARGGMNDVIVIVRCSRFGKGNRS
jgi:hypothetical protein